jgi:hypothetical protein
MLVERRFDGGFQSGSAERLEYIPEGACAHSSLHRCVVGMRGQKYDWHMEMAADGDRSDDAIDVSGESDVHKNQIGLL